jgi:CRISPR-associated exonuclease Cas4
MDWGGLFFALLGAALVALWLARRSRAAIGLPAGRLVYTDTTRWRPVERPLFSRAYQLTGRPDYLVQRGRDLIPVEVKSGQAPPDGPYSSHILQLATYCLLVTEVYDHRPSCGIILYTDNADQAYELDYTPALEEELLTVLDQMRLALVEGNALRQHDEVARCQACSYQVNCHQSLA